MADARLSAHQVLFVIKCARSSQMVNQYSGQRTCVSSCSRVSEAELNCHPDWCSASRWHEINAKNILPTPFTWAGAEPLMHCPRWCKRRRTLLNARFTAPPTPWAACARCNEWVCDACFMRCGVCDRIFCNDCDGTNGLADDKECVKCRTGHFLGEPSSDDGSDW